jgi:hypothetical protein
VARRAVVLSIGTFLLLLTPLTYLEQPDPLWIGGVWDDDDFDAVVVLVRSTEVPCDSDQSVFVPWNPVCTLLRPRRCGGRSPSPFAGLRLAPLLAPKPRRPVRLRSP